jgi:hypothetical protein
VLEQYEVTPEWVVNHLIEHKSHHLTIDDKKMTGMYLKK